MSARSEREEWLHIAAYQNGQRDLILTILDLFGSGVSPDASRWMRSHSEENQRRAAEAEKHAKLDVPMVKILSDYRLQRLQSEISQELERRSQEGMKVGLK